MTDKEIGEFIRKRRCDLGISLQKIADACGVTKSTVSRWETGHISMIKRYHIHMLSEALHISPWTLVGDEPDPKTIVKPEIILKKEDIKRKVDEINDVSDLNRLSEIIDVFIKK